MKKKKLLSMRQLNATHEMIEIAQKDIPKKTTVQYGGYSYQVTSQEYQLYMRCCIENGILKAALYYPDNLRVEGRLPTYEVYIDRSANQFITYDRIHSKWRESKVGRLEWPQMPYAPTVWVSDSDAKAAAEYLGSGKQGYEAILSYQRKLREEARIRRYKKETDAWDADMALTPALPKDWDHWVNKVGMSIALKRRRFEVFQRWTAERSNALYAAFSPNSRHFHRKNHSRKRGQQLFLIML